MKWTNEKIAKEALKYRTRIQFKKNNNAAYRAALRRGILDDVSSHMELVGNKYHRLVYAIVWPDIKNVYIGLTGNPSKRFNSHKNDSSNKFVKQLINDGYNPNFLILNDFIEVEEARKIEKYYVSKYKKDGWSILNIARTGGVGGTSIKWTYDKIKKEALKYPTRTKFCKNNGSAYHAAKKLGIFDDVCKHMVVLWSEKYTKENLPDIAKKYQYKKDFIEKNSGAYCAALRLDILDDICKHMKRPEHHKKYTFDELENIAKKYTYMSLFIKENEGVYRSALKQGVLHTISKHMIKKNK